MASKKSRPLDNPPASSSEEVETEEEEGEEEKQEEEIGSKSQSKFQSKPQSKETDAQDEDSDEAESADCDEEKAEFDDEDEDDDDAQDKKKIKNNTKPANHKAPGPISGSTKKNPPPESSSESDSQKSPRASDFTIKPISASASPDTDTPVSKPSTAKRRGENGKSASKFSKKAKTETATATGEEDEEEGGGATAEKKFAINRLWSEEDEIRILKGLLEFQSKLGKDVSTHNQEFHDFVKASLHVDVTKNQLIDKVRRLKRKFKTNMERSINGEDPSFSKPHELKSFQLCKKIWGNQSDKNNGAVDDEKPSRSSRKIGTTEKSKPVASIEANATPKTAPKEKELVVKGKDDESDDLGKLYPSLIAACQPVHMSNLPIPEFLKSNLTLIGSSELKELDSNWKKQNAAEMEVYLGRIDLLREEARIVLNAMKNNKN